MCIQVYRPVHASYRFELQIDRLKSFNIIDFDMPIHSKWHISNLFSLETTLNMCVAF